MQFLDSPQPPQLRGSQALGSSTSNINQPAFKGKATRVTLLSVAVTLEFFFQCPHTLVAYTLETLFPECYRQASLPQVFNISAHRHQALSSLSQFYESFLLHSPVQSSGHSHPDPVMFCSGWGVNSKALRGSALSPSHAKKKMSS